MESGFVDALPVGMDTGSSDMCIVVAAFNRPDSLRRLLSTLADVRSNGKQLDLVVSIDHSPLAGELVRCVDVFDWTHGRKRARVADTNIGLRRHILACGDLTEHYPSIILLEDDLIVGPNACLFACQAVRFYEADDRVAGISLYSPGFNEMANLPFMAEHSAPDVFALQSAQSWGQCWTHSMWTKFRQWYAEADDPLVGANDMPDRIYDWPASSWKKYAMSYLAETGRTWVYPYVSHSSNCSDVGTHNRQTTALFQTRLDKGAGHYTFAPLDDLVSYDIFFERSGNAFAHAMGRSGLPLIVDLYATRGEVSGPALLLTTRRLPKTPEATFTLAHRPHEAGVILGECGSGATVYMLDSGERVDLRRYPSSRPVEIYCNLEWRDALISGLRGFYHAAIRRLRRSRG